VLAETITSLAPIFPSTANASVPKLYPVGVFIPICPPEFIVKTSVTDEDVISTALDEPP